MVALHFIYLNGKIGRKQIGLLKRIEEKCELIMTH